MALKSKSPSGKREGLQTMLPFFPEDVTIITHMVGVQSRGDTVYYFNGSMPIFQHDQDDIDGFRFIISQLVVNVVCKQVDIVHYFGVSNISVKRWVKRYRESGGLWRPGPLGAKWIGSGGVFENVGRSSDQYPR